MDRFGRKYIGTHWHLIDNTGKLPPLRCNSLKEAFQWALAANGKDRRNPHS